MKIVFGCTRIVLVLNEHVVKIPRIRLIYPIRRFFEHKSNKKVSSELKKINNNLFAAAFKYLFCGFYANRIEYLYSRQTNSPAIVPVKAILWGVILIQPKGLVLSDMDKRWLRLFRVIKKFGIKERDTIRSCNFCIINGRIKILDYGCKETILGLKTINLQIIERLGKI